MALIGDRESEQSCDIQNQLKCLGQPTVWGSPAASKAGDKGPCGWCPHSRICSPHPTSLEGPGLPGFVRSILKGEGLTLELLQPMGEPDPHGSLVIKLLRCQAQRWLPAQVATTVVPHCRPLPLAVVPLLCASRIAQAWKRVPSLNPTETLFHRKRNQSSGRVGNFLSLPESGRVWIPAQADDL